ALHCDATQAVGKIPVRFHALGATTLALSAHKFHGPKGVGALLVRRGTKLRPLLLGGHQHQGPPPRTHPLPPPLPPPPPPAPPPGPSPAAAGPPAARRSSACASASSITSGPTPPPSCSTGQKTDCRTRSTCRFRG